MQNYQNQDKAVVGVISHMTIQPKITNINPMSKLT